MLDTGYTIIYIEQGFPKGIILEVRKKQYTTKDLMMIKKHYSSLGFNGKFLIERDLYAQTKFNET